MPFNDYELEYYHNKGLISDISYYHYTNKPHWIIQNERFERQNEALLSYERRKKEEYDKRKKEQEEAKKRKEEEEDAIKELE